METKIYLPDMVAKRWRKLAMQRFGYGKGSISKAAKEALVFWIEQEEKIRKMFAEFVAIAEKEKGIDALLVFGSYARKEIYRDIDIGIIFNDSIERRKRLEILSKFEDKVPEGIKADISVLNDLDLAIKARAFSEGIVLYAKDKKVLYDYSSNVIREIAEFKPLLDAVLGD